MNLPPHLQLFGDAGITLLKGGAGLTGATLATFHDDIVFIGEAARQVSAVLGAVVAVLMIVNLFFDLRRKQTEANDKRKK